MRGLLGIRGPVRAGVLLGCLALLAGCASMPSSGEVRKVDGAQHDDADTQVRVYGVKPQKGESATQIVSGFLEATTSSEVNYDTAREYLAKDLKKTWNPNARITVLSGGPLQSLESGGTDRTDTSQHYATVSLAGTAVAAVDSKHAYRAVDTQYRKEIHLSKENGEWRIDDVPNGLVLSAADFQRLYRSVDIYFYASLGPDAVAAGTRRDVLVADPVYLRRTQINLLQSTVSSLLSGPTDWLDPVVGSAFPPGTTVKDLSLDDSQHLTVKLSKTVGGTGQDCRLMAAQLMNTVQGVATSPVASVELQGPDGAATCSLSQQQAAAYAPDQVAGAPTQPYFIDTQHRLVSLSGSASTAERVAGPLGAGQVNLGSVAVRRDEAYAAGVKADGSALYVTRLAADAGLGQPVIKSSGQGKENGLSAPSWDGYGGLWVADRNPAKPRLLMLPDGADSPVEVAVPDLGKGRIESLRVAADGVRIAMLVTENGRTTLRLGRIERGGTQQHPQLTVTALRLVTPHLEDVKAASWAGVSRLVVVGQESGGVEQIQYVDVDGSASDTTTLPGISGVASVAASESPDKPLLAELGDGIFRLPTDANWKQVSPKGSSPVYPG
jgi:two-component system sensor histidine kinase MtrB